jgi:hypothetical protein
MAILCYGATSAGKTTTMVGNGRIVGIIHQAIAVSKIELLDDSLG